MVSGNSESRKKGRGGEQTSAQDNDGKVNIQSWLRVLFISSAAPPLHHPPPPSSPPPPTSAERERVPCPHQSSERRRSHKRCVRADTHAIFNPAFNTSHPNHRESSLLKKKKAHEDETKLCSSPCADRSGLLAITALSQMPGVGWGGGGGLMPGLLWGTSNLSVSSHQRSFPT